MNPISLLPLLVFALGACAHAPPEATSVARIAFSDTPREASAPDAEDGVLPEPSVEDPRLPRPASWTRVVTRLHRDAATVTVFEASGTPGDARDDLVRHLEGAGYHLAPVLGRDRRGFERDGVRVVALFAPMSATRSRISVAVLAGR